MRSPNLFDYFYNEREVLEMFFDKLFGKGYVLMLGY